AFRVLPRRRSVHLHVIAMSASRATRGAISLRQPRCRIAARRPQRENPDETRSRLMLKLPAHNRYDHSSIVSRKDYSWPGGKRLAFYVALNIEHFAFNTGIGMDPTNRGGPGTTRNYAWRDYGNRYGNWRLFEMLDELKLPATILLNSMVCYH